MSNKNSSLKIKLHIFIVGIFGEKGSIAGASRKQRNRNYSVTDPFSTGISSRLISKQLI